MLRAAVARARRHAHLRLARVGRGAALALATLLALAAPAAAAPFDRSDQRGARWSTDGTRLAYDAWEPYERLGFGVIALAAGRRAVADAFEVPDPLPWIGPTYPGGQLDPQLRRRARIDAGELVVQTLAGGGELRLPLPAGWVLADAAWSPDGRRLVLDTPTGLGLIELGSGVATTLADGEPGLSFAIWLPSGTRLLVPSGPAWRVVGLDGTLLGALPDGTPSPDLAYVVTTSLATGTELVEVATGGRTRLATRADAIGWLDATRVALEVDGRWLVAGLDGSVGELPFPVGGALRVSFSPDGSLAAYQSADEVGVVETRPPHVVRARVRLTQTLRPGVPPVAPPAWSPDGATLAAIGASTEPCLPGVHLLDVATGALSVLSNDCRVAGTDGDDLLRVQAPAHVTALAGDDVVVIAEGGWPQAGTLVDAGPGDDVVAVETQADSHDRFLGGEGRDLLRGGSEADVLLGGPGDDRLDGGPGNDRLVGGSGDDRLRGGPESVRRGQLDRDRLDAGPGDDVLKGGAREDVLLGRAGADLLVGGAGLDVLAGGPDADDLRARDGEADCLVGLSAFDALRRDGGLDLAVAIGPGDDATDRCAALSQRLAVAPR